jgi:hypothetical protein
MTSQIDSKAIPKWMSEYLQSHPDCKFEARGEWITDIVSQYNIKALYDWYSMTYGHTAFIHDFSNLDEPTLASEAIQLFIELLGTPDLTNWLASVDKPMF